MIVKSCYYFALQSLAILNFANLASFCQSLSIFILTLPYNINTNLLIPIRTKPAPPAPPTACPAAPAKKKLKKLRHKKKLCLRRGSKEEH